VLGSKIRDIRMKKNLKLSQLAEKAGLSTSYISLLERDLTSPSISSLRKIADALDIPLFHFLIEENRNIILTRKEDRKRFSLSRPDSIYEYVTPIPLEHQVRPKLEIVYVELEPDAWNSNEPVSYKSDECLLVLEGKIKVQAGGETYVLVKGDSLYIGEMIPHRYYNLSEHNASMIYALVPPIS